MHTQDELLPLSSQSVREALRGRREIALIDVRDEHTYAQAHPLFAAQFDVARLASDAPWRLPRRDVPIAVYGGDARGDAGATTAVQTLRALGYSRVHLLDGGLESWRRSGGELFRDVNVPSKAFGELVEHERHTPSLSAEEVKALLDARADVVVLDARRFDEYRTMSLPQGISVPGAELVLRVRELAPEPATRVIVNCAGRTRSIIGTQSLVNAGIPNPVAALRNGTIGWTLAGFALEHGQLRRAGPVSAASRDAARRQARVLAERAGAHRLDAEALDAPAERARTVYRYDVRSPEEFAAGHIAGFGSAPGGQLVQETDVYAPVRGARIVLVDDDGVRAPMTAHWLAQMGWDVAWIDGVPTARFDDRSAWPPAGNAPPSPRSGCYRRPYEGTDNPREAMQAYLDWEFGLVAQLGRDGTHGFRVLGPAD